MKIRFSALMLVLVVAVACAQPGSSPAGPTGGTLSAVGQNTPLEATVRFGNDSVGSPFPPPSGHDQSPHAKDNLIPRTVVIDQGGTVTFQMGGGVHAVGIYKDGTRIDQVVRAAAPKAGCPAVYVTGATDPNLLTMLGEPICAGGDPAVSYTFENPGRYLVICTFVPHLNVGMYGWVEVRARGSASND